MHTLGANTVWKAAVRNSRLKHLLTCRLHLIWLSVMTHSDIISSGVLFFFPLLHINFLDSHQRFAVKANINKLVTGSFLHSRITKALQNSLWKLSVSHPWDRHAGHVLPSDALLLQFLWSCHQLPLWPEENPSCIEGVREHVYAEVLMNLIFEKRVVKWGKKENLKGNSGIGYI